MAWHDNGNQPINSTFAPVAGPSTSTLMAELDSTQLGTKNFTSGQKLLVQVSYVLGSDTNTTWQVGTCASTALGAGVDEFYPKTATGQSGQFTAQHTLEKDHRIRARIFSVASSGSAYISAIPLT